MLGGVVGAGVVPLTAPGGASLAFGAVPELSSLILSVLEGTDPTSDWDALN